MANTAPPSMPQRRKTTLTREGACWLLGTVAFWLTGWLKGINLILLVAYLLLLLVALNWLIARRALRGAVARRAVRQPIFAQTRITWEAEVAVEGRRPLTGWELRDQGPGHDVRWFLMSTEPGAPVRLRREITLTRRGPYDCPPLRAVTSYPFGLVRREVEFGSPERFMILPRLGRVHTGRLRRWLMQSGRPDERARRSRRRLAIEAEFHGLRQFRPGDSPRWIHWRTSARTGELVVREFDHGTHHDLVLIVEPFAESRESPAVDAAMSLAATISWAWSKESGDRVVLGIAGPKPVVRTTGDDPTAVVDLLEALAAAEGDIDIDAAGLCRRLQERSLPPGPAVLVSSRSDGRTADELGRHLGRPVAYLNAAAPPTFYQPPVLRLQ
jgi:uncharacterized protein (DUF58 family)